jgi:hypothetical protein
VTGWPSTVATAFSETDPLGTATTRVVKEAEALFPAATAPNAFVP